MSGGSRVSIPKNVQGMIRDIKEIAGDNTDDDIYAVLKECNMDPNETAQRLLYLGTFHEVKRKRDRAKKNQNLSGPSNYKGGRGGRGDYNLNNVYYDAAGGRNAGARKENGFNHSTRPKNNVTSNAQKPASLAPSGSASISNGNLGQFPAVQSAIPQASGLAKDCSATVDNKICAALPQPSADVEAPCAAKGKDCKGSAQIPSSTTQTSSTGVDSSASDPVLVQPLNAWTPVSVGAIRREVGSQNLGSEPNVQSSAGGLYANHNINSFEETTDPSKVETDAQTPPSENLSAKIPKRLELIFPNNLQVPEAYKNGLIFGSLDASFVSGKKDVDSLECEQEAVDGTKSCQNDDEVGTEPCPSNQSMLSTAPEEEYLNHPQSPAHVSADLLPSEANVTSDAASKFDQLKQDLVLPPEVPQYPVNQSASSYNFGFVAPMLSSTLLPAESPEPQARDVSQLSNFASGTSTALASSGPTPPVTQPAGVVPSSLAVSPPPPPIYRPPFAYPLNHYFSPFYMPTVHHQYIGHSGFPQQPSSGSVYLTPAAAAAGLKFSVPQHKPSAITGNPTQVGLPSAYGTYATSPLGYSPSPTMTSGSSSGIENLTLSQTQSKEINSYITGQQSEGSTVWIPGPGQDVPTLQASSFYNFPPQGQHVAFSPQQAAGAFAGVYHPTQTMAAPASAHPLLQQSQAMAGSLEKMGPLPSSAYQQQQQQQQHAQINWNTNY